MRAINVEQLKTGMRIARTIYDDVGRILLNAGVVLNALYIEKLTSLGIPFIYIEDEILGHLEVDDVINDKVKLQTVKAVKDVVKSASVQSSLDIRPVSDMVNEILDELKGVSNLMIQFIEPTNKNAYLYSHSVGVSVLSILTGIALGLDDLKLKTLGMGSILHDLGKSLNKGPEHTTHGFEILRQIRSLNILIAHVAFQHHEKYDGTGYPRKLQGEGIHQYAAITSVANTYYNLVTNPNNHARIYPYQALEQILAESGKSFNPEVVKAFSRNIAPYPVGATVRLNNGIIGVVIEVFRDFPTRPIIKQITNNTGGIQKSFPEINLIEEKNLCIKGIITEQERQKLTKINPV